MLINMETEFLVVILMISVATGRPELGYDYRQPSGGGGGFIGSNTIGSGFSLGGQSSIGTSSFGSHLSSFGSTSGSFGGTGLSSSGGLSSGSLGGYNGVGGGAYTSSSSAVSSGGFVQRPTLIQKHIYVHVPPPEPEEINQQRQISLGVPQKHYKIIFIKVPTAPSISQQQIALSAQSQEKTIVYVLVKKPDEISDLQVPQIQSTPPSKPEVYFIKYKAQKQAIATGGGVSEGYQTPSAGLGISTGDSSISTGTIGVPAPQYGPPGKSGPY